MGLYIGIIWGCMIWGLFSILHIKEKRKSKMKWKLGLYFLVVDREQLHHGYCTASTISLNPELGGLKKYQHPAEVYLRSPIP